MTVSILSLLLFIVRLRIILVLLMNTVRPLILLSSALLFVVVGLVSFVPSFFVLLVYSSFYVWYSSPS